MEQLSLDGFEPFEQVRKVLITEPRLVVGAGGRLSINKKAYSDYFVKHKAVKFYYNKDTKVIAMKFYDEHVENTYAIKVTRKSGTGFINCSGFFNHNKIDTKVKRETEWLGTSDNDTVVYFKLK